MGNIPLLKNRQEHTKHETDLVLREHNGQHSVLEAVVEENISKACRNDTADSEVINSPGSMLAGRAATEVVACNKDLAVAVWSLFVAHVFVSFAVCVPYAV
jgi:hypothetical protein